MGLYYISELLWSLITGISRNRANHTTITAARMAAYSSESFILMMFSTVLDDKPTQDALATAFWS